MFRMILNLRSSIIFTHRVRIRTLTTLPNLKPFNSKITSLMRNGLVAEAHKLFDEMPQRNTVTWNAMISGFFRNGNLEKALEFYDEMPERDVFSYNTVIAGLMKFGDVDGAKRVFDRTRCKDVVTWNSMISGYVQNGFMDEAIVVFGMTPFKDVVSWNLMMSGFLSVGRVKEARKCFDTMPMKDVQAWNTMISGYINEGLINDAMSLFGEMPQKCQKVWNAIVLAIIRNGLVNECHALIEKSPYQNIVSLTNLIIGYFSIGEVVNAVKLFNLMPTVDTTLCNVMIYGLGESDHGEDGMKLFIKTKKRNLFLDESTYTSVLTICSSLPSLGLGKQTHAQVIKSGLNCFTPVSNALLTMYARCGDLDFALLEFFSMCEHDIISWNSIICGLAYHGYGEKALTMFKQMTLTKIKPNEITFVGVLSACSHTGLVNEGKYYFDVMRYEYLIKPTSEHYTCIIDLFSRFGVVNEAGDILMKMIADGIKVPASVWGSMLGACRLHKEYDLGKMVGEKMLELEPSNSGAYMILTEMHLHSENRNEAANVLVRMRDKGVKKQPGCSWIEVNGSGHAFIAGENSHPEFQSICVLLNLMHKAIDIG